MIAYLPNKNIKINRIKNDNQGRILLVNADIDEETFVLIDFYNANAEKEQIKPICGLDQLIGDFYLGSKQNTFFAGDFNLFLDKKINFKTCANI